MLIWNFSQNTANAGNLYFGLYHEHEGEHFSQVSYKLNMTQGFYERDGASVQQYMALKAHPL